LAGGGCRLEFGFIIGANARKGEMAAQVRATESSTANAGISAAYQNFWVAIEKRRETSNVEQSFT
jgi:hypothetical protein